MISRAALGMSGTENYGFSFFQQLDEDCDNDSIGTSTTCPSTVLNPHARFPLGLPLPLPPVPTSAWNPVTNPWMSPQFRSPLNPFLPRKLIQNIQCKMSMIFCFSLF